MKTTIKHPHNEDLSFEAIYFPAEKATGEWMYSIGTPPSPEDFEVEKIFYRGTDITEFVIDYCGDLFDKFSEELCELKRCGKISI